MSQPPSRFRTLFAAALLSSSLAVACGGGEDEPEPCPGDAERNPITDKCTTVPASDTGIRGRDGASQDADGPEDSGTEMSEDTSQNDAGAEEDATTGEDTSNDATGSDPDASECSDTSSGDDPEGARLEGVVTRTSDSNPEEDGKGNLYIALLDKDPVANPNSAEAVSFALICNADMSDPSNEIPYALPEIPPRDEDYYISAFLDDDGDATGGPEEAGPDQGDLVNLEGFTTIPTTSVTEAKTYERTIELTKQLPIDPGG